jgi:hypothetical protein
LDWLVAKEQQWNNKKKGLWKRKKDINKNYKNRKQIQNKITQKNRQKEKKQSIKTILIFIKVKH